MASRAFRLVFIIFLVVLAHAGVLLVLAQVNARSAAVPSAAAKVSLLPASQVKYCETRLRLGESPAPPELPALLPPPVHLSVRFIPMSEPIEEGSGFGVQGSGTKLQMSEPAFLALARRKPPGFEAAAGPEKGILKGHEGLARHLEQVSRQGFDVVFVFDTTESMAGVIKEVKEKIKLMMRILAELVPGFRVGVVAYRDYAAAYVTNPLPLTNDLPKVYDYIEKTTVGMGYKTVEEQGREDIEWSEAVYSGLNEAINLNWRPSAKKVIVLIGDAPPHSKEMEETLAIVRSFWKSGKGVVHTIFIPPEIHTAKPAADLLDPKVRALFTESELKFLMQHDNKRLTPKKQPSRAIEEIFRNIADNGGGECVLLSDEKEIVREMLNSALGRQWRGDIDEIYNVLKQKQ
jgi:hypothetical protein